MPARMNSRLIVILNDNDMSIAPPVGALSAYLARLVSGRTYRSVRHTGEEARQAAAAVPRAARGAHGGICARPRHRRHPVRGARLLLCRPDRRPQHRSPAAGAAERARRQERAVPGPRRDPEGQGLSRRPRKSADKYHGVVKFDVATGAQAKSKPAAPTYTKVFAESADRGGEEGRQDRRHHRRDAVGHRPRPVRQGLSRPLLRRRHRRAACRDLRRRPRDRRLEAVRRDLLDLPAARLRPGRARRRDPAAAGALRHGPRRPRRRRRPDPCRRLRRRLSRLPARFRDHGGGRRGRAGAHGGDAVAIDDRPSALRYPRGEGIGVAMPAEGVPLEIGKGRIVREGTKVALLSFGTRLGRMPQGRGRAGARSGFPPRSPMRASPSRSTPISCCGSRASTRC